MKASIDLDSHFLNSKVGTMTVRGSLRLESELLTGEIEGTNNVDFKMQSSSIKAFSFKDSGRRKNMVVMLASNKQVFDKEMLSVLGIETVASLLHWKLFHLLISSCADIQEGLIHAPITSFTLDDLCS